MDQRRVVELPEGPVLLTHKLWNQETNRNPCRQAKPPRKPLSRFAEQDMLPPGLNKQDETNRPLNGKKYEFINSIKPFRNRDPAIRTLVRTHVMKDCKKRRIKQQDVHVEDQAAQSESQTYQKKKITDFEPKFSQLNTSLTIQKGCEPPLNIFPVHVQPQVQILLIRYLTTVPGLSFRFNTDENFDLLRAEWFRAALTDKALFHGFLYAALVSLGLLDGVMETDETMFQTDRILHLVNQGLKEAQGIVPDAILGAVSCLAWGEAVRRQPENWNLHMKGLKKMVELRGGISALGISLRLKLLRADIAGAIDYGVQPYFQHQQLGPLSPYQQSSTYSGSSADYSLAVNLISAGLPIEIVKLFQDMNSFSHEVLQAIESNTISSKVISLIEEYSILQHRLFLSSNSSILNGDQCIEEACRMGGLIYLREFFRNIPFSTNALQNVVRRLKYAMKDFSDWYYLEPLHLWLFFMGGVAALSGVERAWFITRLVIATDRLLILTWPNVTEALMKILWIEKIHEKTCRELWEEVEMARIVLHQRRVS